MKKIIFIVLTLIICYSINAQGYMDFGGGYDITKSKGIGNINFGAEVRHVVVSGVIQPSIRRSNNENNYLGMSIGYDIKNIIPTIGYYYNVVNNEDKGANSNSIGYGLKVILPLLENKTGLYVKCLYIDNQYQLTSGLHIVFSN